MLRLKFTKNSFLRNLLYIPSNKSSTSAILLGGLPLNLLLIFSVEYILYKSPASFLTSEFKILKIFIYTLITTLIYGYVDDRLEIRPVMKLIFQFITNSVMAILIGKYFYPQNSAWAFVAVCLMSTAIMNGSNLLDGLDTLASKMAIINCTYFLMAGLTLDCHSAVFISLIVLSLIFSFYLFNMEPAKIYLGEIGSVSLGLSYIVMGMEVFIHLRHDDGGMWRAISVAIIPSCLSVVELVVSFTRRFMNQRSPFRGDRLHIHYLLMYRFGISASRASSAVAAIHLVGIILALLVFQFHSLVTPLIVQSIFYLTTYYYLGRKFWKISGEKITVNYLFDLILKKEGDELASVIELKKHESEKQKAKERKKKAA